MGLPHRQGEEIQYRAEHKHRIPGDAKCIITSWCFGHKHIPPAPESHPDCEKSSVRALNRSIKQQMSTPPEIWAMGVITTDGPNGETAQGIPHVHAPETFVQQDFWLCPYLSRRFILNMKNMFYKKKLVNKIVLFSPPSVKVSP